MDIKKLLRQPKVTDVTDLGALFNRLDRKGSHIDLRPAQADALEKLTQRREERDLVLKISTGSGKTTVGLLYLLSRMRASGGGVVYLCPTVQLVGQVCEEARKLGIDAIPYNANESTCDPKCTAAKAITVCTYDKLFNGRSTFNRSDMWLPTAIVLDDAHAGIEIARQNFTMRLSGSDAEAVVWKALKGPMAKYNPSGVAKLEAADPQAIFEVPHWIWRNVAAEVLPKLAALASSDSAEKALVFPWQFVQEGLETCRCVIAAAGIEIAPLLPRLDLVSAYSRARHRLFMSATLVDDSSLVRELGCAAQAAGDPVVPKNDRGVGERMVIAPSLLHPTIQRVDVAALCLKLSQQGHRVAVLTKSESEAEEWKNIGATVATKGEVSEAIDAMKKGLPEPKFVVFPRRYDGVDLPDDACRVLVIDGIPAGDGLIDKLDSGSRSTPGGARSRLIYRIEQGMGRATRSHADYAVVLLSGQELANFVVRRDVLELFNPDTIAQLKLAESFEQGAREEKIPPIEQLETLMNYCLRRDEDWKLVYDQQVRQPQAEAMKRVPDELQIKLAAIERSAFDDAVVKRRFSGAAGQLRLAANDAVTDIAKATMLQTAARYLMMADDPEWGGVQAAAVDFDRSCFRPPEMPKRPRKTQDMTQADSAIAWFRSFSNPNGAILALEELKGALAFGAGSSTAAEDAIEELGQAVGFGTSRPEKDLNEGPDVLWFVPGLHLVIEVKSENQKTLHKKDSGQLHTSLEWFERTYGTTKVWPVIGALMAEADSGSQFPKGTRVLRSAELLKLVEVLQAFYRKVGALLPIEVTPKSLQLLQAEFHLLPENIISNYSVQIAES